MTDIARTAATKTLSHLANAELEMIKKGTMLPKERPRNINIYTVKELVKKAADQFGSVEKLQLEISKVNSSLATDV